MGKNKKDKKKASKAAKTAGEDDVAAVIAQLEAEEAAKWRPLMELTEPANGDSEFRPSPRIATANSRRSEIYLFGGEQRLPETGRLKVLNEHLVYRPVENRWIRLGGGTLPTPRRPWPSRPQASGDHLFVFGGEFATPTESQFHHYDDIWSWDRKVASVAQSDPGLGQPGPLSRSGHRMLALKRP
uniref:Kelch domain-containing protein 4 n=1 Tax=Macrostomum lignano TaxID=282301 RepID=A0A1I8ILP0_9PLAT